MRTLVNPVAVRPNELKGGDIMAVIVTCHVIDWKGHLRYQLYRCPFPPGDSMHNGIPQGSRISDEEAVATQLFPVVGAARTIPDY